MTVLRKKEMSKLYNISEGMKTVNKVMNKVNPILVAKYIICFGEIMGFHISPLKLQKILWYTTVEYYYKYNKPLFVENFEAWRYGPVLRGVWDHFFNKYDGYNNPPKLKINGDYKLLQKNENIKKIIESIVYRKGNQSPFSLSEETHKQKPWKQTTLWNEIDSQIFIDSVRDIKEKYLS